MSCGIGGRRGSDPELLWLWRRLVATAQIGSLAWEPPYAAGGALEDKNKQRNKQTKKPGAMAEILGVHVPTPGWLPASESECSLPIPLARLLIHPKPLLMPLKPQSCRRVEPLGI